MMKQRILPIEKTIFDVDLYEHKIAIVIHLFYFDQMEHYVRLVNAIPESIDIYIISSNKNYLDEFSVKCDRKVLTEQKNNRGRDVSALLVHFAPKACQYEYICFLHDKKESEEFLAEDVSFWNRNLQENTIGSVEYINNIIGLFEANPQLGVIVPPAPIGKHYSTWLGEYPWESVFERISDLKTRLDLRCDIDQNYPNVSIGGVLWFRYKALRKILEYSWKYEDFPEEPLPSTGTISHAIERIYPYVAADEGYESICSMSDKYAEDMLNLLQTSMSDAMKLLKRSYGIHTISQLDNAIERKEELSEFCNHKKIYIYGSGDYGQDLSTFLFSELNVIIQGFLVSDNYKSQNYVQNKPVYGLQDIDFNGDVGVIVSVKSYRLSQILKSNLEKVGCTNYYIDYKDKTI